MDKDVIIRVEGLGKRYTLGAASNARYVALRDVLAQGARRLLRGVRRGDGGRAASTADETDFWALRDVDFEVRRGEVVGIIGRNGAGKSTLLKILSRITEPTVGKITLKGRVASLLEVGTGFHPELTGRENIFLNGAILGMHRREIRAKFDEIVAFAEVERFLDTPVKRYSSGMYVRLAFAVAAHLEPEILIVDEVLAVGDAEFQKKCLGKMQDVSRGGRTVLFVSHNMAAITALTKKGILLSSGKVIFNGPTAAATENYVQLSSQGTANNRPNGRGIHTKIHEVVLLEPSGGETGLYTSGQPFVLAVVFETDGTSGLSLELFLLDERQQKTALFSLFQFDGCSLPSRSGLYRCFLEIAPLWLASGVYSLDVTTSVSNSSWDHYVENALNFEIPYSNPGSKAWDFRQGLGLGVLAMRSNKDVRFEEMLVEELPL